MTTDKCSVEGCSNDSRRWGYCEKHAQQILRHGHIQVRTKYTPNEFEVKGGICLISLYDNKNNVKAKAIVDAEQYNNVILRKWHLTTFGYVCASDGIYLHHFIMGEPPVGQETDHKDRNKLDSRKDNLRFCTHMDNKINQPALSNNTSGYKGVSWDRQHNKWQAGICYNGKKINLGLFVSKIDAAKAFNKAVQKYQNIKFGYLNLVGGI